MHPLLLSGTMFVIGVLVVCIGRAWRRGSHPVCRRCGFHLAGLKAGSSCPECGRTLTACRATATGDRRRWPVPAGLAIIGVAVLAMAYAILDNPALDPRKPVWLLEAEYRLFGESREPRLLDEVERRIAAVPSTDAEWKSLADLVFQASASPEVDPRWHGRAVVVIRQGWVSPERAQARAATVLREYAGLSAEDQRRLEGTATDYASMPHPSDEAIRPLLDRVEADYQLAKSRGEEAVDRWTESPARAVLSTWVQANHMALTADSLNRIIGDFDGIELRVKPMVGEGEKVPIEIAMDALTLAYGNPLWLFTEVTDLRFNGASLDRFGRHEGTSGVYGIGRRGRSAQRVAHDLPPDVPLGDISVEVDIELGVSFANEPPDSRSDERPTGVAITRSASFKLVTEGDAVEWARSDDPEDQRRVLESIGVVGVTYFSGESPVQAMRWRFPIRIFDPPFDIAHALWAEQGEDRWRIGQITVKAGANTRTTLSGPRDRLVRRGGRTINETVHPDLELPVRIVLEPEASIATGLVDTVRPWGATIDLGTFEIVETSQDTGFGVSSDQFVPPPALSEPE